MKDPLYENLKIIIQHPEKKKILENLLFKEIKNMIKNLLETLDFGRKKNFL